MSQHKLKEIKSITKDTKPGVYRMGKKVVTHTGQDCLVQQSDKHLTDVNKLLEPAMRKGALRHSVKFAGQYDDIPFRDYQDAQMQIAKAKNMYEELPANIRQEFDTPGKFLEFAQNPKNVDRLMKMGILKGNDGVTAKGTPSGAPTPTDKDGNPATPE